MQLTGLHQAIFLDRDGVLNRDDGYVHKICDWHWLPRALEACAKLEQAGWLLLVVSNQSGIGRGYFDRKDLAILENWLNAQMLAAGAKPHGWYYCPHTPEDNCYCRKPSPELIIRAAGEWQVDLAKSWALGDRLRDVEAGLAAGCQVGILRNENHFDEWLSARQKYPQIRQWRDLADAAEHILQESDNWQQDKFIK